MRFETFRHKTVRHKSVRHKTLPGITSVAKPTGGVCLNDDFKMISLINMVEKMNPKDSNVYRTPACRLTYDSFGVEYRDGRPCSINIRPLRGHAVVGDVATVGAPYNIAYLRHVVVRENVFSTNIPSLTGRTVSHLTIPRLKVLCLTV
ncbi:MAG: hypothetical protein FWG84_05140 [Bacteroidales bacterium]|nr:hypothetical protein [Bacteroidales bacterium]